MLQLLCQDLHPFGLAFALGPLVCVLDIGFLCFQWWTYNPKPPRQVRQFAILHLQVRFKRFKLVLFFLLFVGVTLHRGLLLRWKSPTAVRGWGVQTTTPCSNPKPSSSPNSNPSKSDYTHHPWAIPITRTMKRDYKLIVHLYNLQRGRIYKRARKFDVLFKEVQRPSYDKVLQSSGCGAPFLSLAQIMLSGRSRHRWF